MFIAPVAACDATAPWGAFAGPPLVGLRLEAAPRHPLLASVAHEVSCVASRSTCSTRSGAPSASPTPCFKPSLGKLRRLSSSRCAARRCGSRCCNSCRSGRSKRDKRPAASHARRSWRLIVGALPPRPLAVHIVWVGRRSKRAVHKVGMDSVRFLAPLACGLADHARSNWGPPSEISRAGLAVLRGAKG